MKKDVEVVEVYGKRYAITLDGYVYTMFVYPASFLDKRGVWGENLTDPMKWQKSWSWFCYHHDLYPLFHEAPLFRGTHPHCTENTLMSVCFTGLDDPAERVKLLAQAGDADEYGEIEYRRIEKYVEFLADSARAGLDLPVEFVWHNKVTNEWMRTYYRGIQNFMYYPPKWEVHFTSFAVPLIGVSNCASVHAALTASAHAALTGRQI